MPKTRTAAEQREYRARRRAAGNPTDQNRGAYFRSYRRKRVDEGRPVPSRVPVRRVILWDGEGITIEPQRAGLFPGAWNDAVRAHADMLQADVSDAPLWAALAQVGVTRVTRKILARDDLDVIAAIAGVTYHDLVDWLESEPGRMTRMRALAIAREQLAGDRARPAPHRYVMLANSAGDYLEDAGGIRTADALDLLVRSGRDNPGAIHAIYGGSYDFTKILEDLDRDAIAAIVKNETDHDVWVTDAGELWDPRQPPPRVLYAIGMRQRKFLRVSRFRDPAKRFARTARNTWRPDYDARITLWDVIGFFQSTFVRALRDWKIEADLGAIEQMKKRRSSFAQADTLAMREYCIAECRAGADLVEKLLDALRRAHLRPARFDGAGAVAGTLLRRERVRDHIVDEPAVLARPIASAYFGGRIELAQLGWSQAPVYGYDIASAYPKAAADLPSLIGTWRHTRTAGFCLLHVRWDLPAHAPFYPLPYRSPNGSIAFPPTGEGWYWRPEVDAALAWCEALGGNLEILDAYSFEPSSDVRPFAFIEPLFAERQKRKLAGDASEKAIKLALSSLYGKTAQQVGARNGRRPPYFALSWAGWVTAQTRATLLEAALTDPWAVVMFATDGIYATRALPIACIPPSAHREPGFLVPLGAWEGPAIAQAGVFAQAGVYWLYEGDAWKPRYRGFDRETMESPAIALDIWAQGHRSVDVDTTRFITFGTALAPGDDRWEWRGTWRTAPRRLDLSGASPKRLPIARDARPYDGLVPLRVREAEWYRASREPSRPFDSITLAVGYVDGVDARIVDDEVDAAWV